MHFRDAAKEYFLKAGNYEKLISCYHFLEDYEGLEWCMSMLPEKDPLLEKLGEIFFNVGMCSQAVDAYSKVCDVFVRVLVQTFHVNFFYILNSLPTVWCSSIGYRCVC